MMEMRFWEDNSLQHVKYESNSNDNIPPRSREPFYCEAANLNFATGDEDCMDYAYRKSQVRVSRQDPLSHRIIEKRRRDRMNNCLADLSRLIPTEYLKKGRGRVEKTEIIEMAIKHMKHLQFMNHYRLGYQDCIQEAMRFMVEVEGHFPREPICVRLLGHLQQHCDGICRNGTEASQTHSSQVTVSPMSENATKVEPKIEPTGGYDCDQSEGNINGNGYDIEIDNEVNMEPKHDEPNTQEHNMSGYKYKNDIKLRFCQDNAKTPNSLTSLPDRRNSTPISTDQTCSSLGSPTHIHDSTISTTPNIKASAQEYDQFTTLSTPWTLSHIPPRQDIAPNRPPNTLMTIQKPIATFANGITNGHINGHNDDKCISSVPAFVLHTKGSFYIPVTLDYHVLLPYLSNQDALINLQHDVVLHPVAINVNFQQQPLNLQQPKKKFEKLPN